MVQREKERRARGRGKYETHTGVALVRAVVLTWFVQGLPLQNLLICVPTPTRSPTMMLVSTWDPTRVALRMVSCPATGIACRCVATSSLRKMSTAPALIKTQRAPIEHFTRHPPARAPCERERASSVR
jgi:hypothetical protein